MFNRIISSPIAARVLPFGIFAAFTLIQGRFGDASQYWIYTLKTFLAFGVLWFVWPHVKEMRWKVSWEAVLVGILVFLAWVGLDGHYPMLAAREGSFNPLRTYGTGTVPAVLFIIVRTIGSTLVVPPLEEVFYRSLLYRYLIQSDFLNVPLRLWDWRAFLIVSVAFGISHYKWLPGILCGFAYQALVCRKNRLGDAMTAHAVTNFLLAVYVVLRSAYQFW
jgi:uncharacterized protein